MSSLIYYATTDEAVIVTDTLVTHAGHPAFFTTKANHVPHLRMIVAGTGAAGFAGEWIDFASKWMLVEGIEHLDQFTPAMLRERWAAERLKRGIPPEQTTTVYHFGFSERSDQLVLFAYRSAQDFASERIEIDGSVFAAKPDCSFPEGDDLFRIIETMMREQRSIEDAKPVGERVHIGGEAIAMHLKRDGCRTFSLFRFEDINTQMREAVALFNAAPIDQAETQA